MAVIKILNIRSNSEISHNYIIETVFYECLLYYQAKGNCLLAVSNYYLSRLFGRQGKEVRNLACFSLVILLLARYFP